MGRSLFEIAPCSGAPYVKILPAVGVAYTFGPFHYVIAGWHRHEGLLSYCLTCVEKDEKYDMDLEDFEKLVRDGWARELTEMELLARMSK